MISRGLYRTAEKQLSVEQHDFADPYFINMTSPKTEVGIKGFGRHKSLGKDNEFIING